MKHMHKRNWGEGGIVRSANELIVRLSEEGDNTHDFSQRFEIAGQGMGTQQKQVAIYLETYFIKNKEKTCLLYIDILFNFIFLENKTLSYRNY